MITMMWTLLIVLHVNLEEEDDVGFSVTTKLSFQT